MIIFEDQRTTERTSVTPGATTDVVAARIMIVGIGGGGGNAVDRMIDADLKGIEFMAVNTDLQALRKCRAPLKLQLGQALTRGLGAGADPEIGRKAALEDTEAILKSLDGANMVFIAAGLGGGTGSGAAPILASLASEIGALTVAVVTKPFGFEGKRRMSIADQAVEDLRSAVDTLITIPNERLLNFVERGMPLTEAFHIADDVLRQGVQGISDLITVVGDINVDFADVRTIMTGMGRALLGTGFGKGEHRAIEAARRAISSPLLEETSIQGASSVLVNISGGRDLTLHEVAEAAQIIAEAVDPEANIISGMVIDESMGETIAVTVIATGFETAPEKRSVGAKGSSGEEMRDHSTYEPTAVTQPHAGLPDRRPTSERLKTGLAAGRDQFSEKVQEGSSAEPDIAFYRKALAHRVTEDSGGFGPNWSSVDDYDIPTVLRKQMD